MWIDTGFGQGLCQRGELRFPNLVGIVFYPSGLWIVLFEFFLCDAQHITLLIKEDAAAAGRALIERKNNGHANRLVSLR
jgi:hypothetical protein